MDRDTIIAIVQGRMVRTDNTAQAILEFQAAQRELEQAPFLPWFLQAVDDTLVTVASTETVTAPAALLREIDEEPTGLWVIDSTTSPVQYKPLRKYLSYAELLDKYRYDEPGEPKGYFLMGSQYRLRPLPNVVYTLRSMHYAADTVLSANGTNQWTTNAAELLMARLGILLTRYDADKTLHDMFVADYTQAIARLQVFDESRRQAGLDAVSGGDDL